MGYPFAGRENRRGRVPWNEIRKETSPPHRGSQVMPDIGYHASHEQFSPRELLDLAQEAERAGFAACMCSDHFLPWTDAQGQSGFAWSWLGAAMQATALPMGTVTAPGDR